MIAPNTNPGFVTPERETFTSRFGSLMSIRSGIR